jgi:zinc/manganese transport system substrate-binding protein
MEKFALAALLAALAFCSPAEAADKPLRVIASFSILADMARTVGGEDVTITSLVGPDSDTHMYQPTPRDAQMLAGADIILVNGLGFDAWMQRLVAASGTKAQVIVAAEGVAARTQTKDAVDPHAWQNLAYGRIYAGNIARAFEQALPDKAAAIQKRAEAYDAALAETDRFVRAQFADIPTAQRKIITSHDAFGYFGAAYGITFLAPVGMNTEAEPAAADMAKLIAQIRQEGIKRIFIENMTNPKLVEQIGKDTGASLGGALYSDALSEPDGPAPTYLAMFQNNVPKLRAAMLLNKP